MKVEYTKELLEPIVQRVFTYSDMCRELGLHPHSGNIKTMHRKIDEYNLDVSHFDKKKSSKSRVCTKQGTPIETILVEHSTYANTNSLRKRLIKEGYKETDVNYVISMSG